MSATSIESILIGSTDPAGLRAWYAQVLGVSVDIDGFLDFGGVAVLTDARDDIAPRTAEPGRVIINYHVPDIHAAARRLESFEVPWVSGVEYRDAGLWFATVEDPDGNYVQLIQTTPAYWTGKRARAGTGPLEHARAAVRLPAQDLDRARRWYAQSLGLEPVEEREGGLRYRCGGTEFVVFASTGRASGDHTQMGFTVPDLDRAVAELWERGVEFESEIVEVHGNYPSTGASGERATWFRDSEGNLLGLGQYSYD